MGRHGLIAAALALLLTGCGATPPQAPGPQAYELNNALSGISTACGHASEIQAFSRGRRDLTTTEHEARKQVQALTKVFRQNSDWIFQGKTVAQLVDMSVKFLDECGLHQSARRLAASTSSK